MPGVRRMQVQTERAIALVAKGRPHTGQNPVHENPKRCPLEPDPSSPSAGGIIGCATRLLKSRLTRDEPCQ